MATGQLQSVDSLLSGRDVKKAEILLARLLRSDLPDDERAHLLTRRARAKLLTGRIDDALEDLKVAQSLLPNWSDTPEDLEILGDCHLARFELASVGFADRSDTTRAQLAYESILTRFPEYENIGWVLYQKGRALLTENRVDEAVTCFKDALLNPSQLPSLTAYCYERLGFVSFYEMRDSRRALVFLDKAIHTYPSYEPRPWLIQVYTLHSRVLRDMRRYAAALESAETGIHLAAASSETRHELADALLTAGEILWEMDGREKDAATYLQQFVQISRRPLGVDVTWARVHEMLGDSYFRMGQYQAAVTAYQAVLQFNPYHPWEQSLHYRMARSYYQLGEYEKTVTALEKMLSTAHSDGEAVTDYRAFTMLGSAHYALKHYNHAVEAYQRALDTAPSNADLDSIKQYLNTARQLSGAKTP